MEKMKILHLLATAGVGGIEVLLKNHDEYSKHENVYVCVWDGGLIADELKKRNRKVIILKKTNAQFLSTLKTFLKICKEEKIQAIVVHHESPMLRILMVALKLIRPNMPVIAYAHANALVLCNQNKPKGFFLRKLIQQACFRTVDGIIAISNSVKNSLENFLKVNSQKIEVIYNGVPLKEFSRTSLENADEKYCFTYVGRLSEEKGVQNIIHLFSTLDKELLEKIRLQIVGDGPYRTYLTALAEKKGLTDVISFMGNRTDVSDILSKSHFFVHFPTCEEGFGIAVVEAMAAGSICVCLNKGAIPEIITHGKNGFLLDTLSPEEFKETISYLMSHISSDTLKAVQNNAVNRANDFSIELFSEKFDKYICDLCHKKISIFRFF